MSSDATNNLFDFDYAYLRVVPHVHVDSGEVVGVVLHSRTSGFIGIRYLINRTRLTDRWPSLDIEMVEHELLALAGISKGGESAGPIGLLPPSERFHWMTAPRSAVIQPTNVHAGKSANPEVTLNTLFASAVS